MKSLADQSHYEVLEITPDADAQEIERAYRVTRAAFADDSAGLYSVYGDLEAQAIRERIETAYQVLSDAETRAAYDLTLGEAPHDGAEAGLDLEIALAPDVARRSHDPAQQPPPVEEFEDLESEEGSAYDGARLRRSRLRRGMELEQIAKVTKVSLRYLGCLEDERFEELPAPVYVRGFVSAYARCLGLDPARVAPSYMDRYEEARGAEKDRGTLGRR